MVATVLTVLFQFPLTFDIDSSNYKENPQILNFRISKQVFNKIGSLINTHKVKENYSYLSSSNKKQ